MNYKEKILMEKKVKMVTFNLAPKEEIAKTDEKIMAILNQKEGIQKLILAYIDTFIEDSFLWQF